MFIYSIKDHKHRFAAWAAGRAASVKGCRFSVEVGREIIEYVRLERFIENPDDLPQAHDVDRMHKLWREAAILKSQEIGHELTHGVAAKLINVYLKSALVCGGYHDHLKVKLLHPPVDGLILGELLYRDIGNHDFWRNAVRIRWSKFSSDQYDDVIINIRKLMPEGTLWKVESFWRGYQ